MLERNPSTKIKLLYFGKANADEAKANLPKQVDVSTVHSMAYQYTIKPLKLKLPIRAHIRVSDVPKSLVDKHLLSSAVKLAESFVTSTYTSVSKFITDTEYETDDVTTKAAIAILGAMERGRINVTHSFYLKLFHSKVLNGTIKIKPVDVLIIDEAQDLTQVMIDVIDRYQTSQLIYSGDVKQAILGFTGAVDVLSLNKGKGTELSLTKSFRVNTDDAKIIQHFMRNEIDKDFIFEGFDKPYPDNPTYAYLTRTNAALISKMIDLDRSGTPFKLATKSKLSQMFSLPLTLATLKPNGEQVNNEMQYLQDTTDYYYRTPMLATRFPTLFGYLRYEYKENPAVIQALDLVAKHGTRVLFGVYKSAKEHMKTECNLTLSTVHIFKGSTVTEVELDPSCDKALIKALEVPLESRTEDDISEIYLAYVSYSRHTHVLKGSKLFDTIKYNI